MKAHEIAQKAASLVSGDRNETHGDARQNCQNIARLWTAYLQAKFRNGRVLNLNGEDVSHLMNLLKIARTMSGTHNPDDHIDAVGYAAIAGELAGDNAEIAAS